MIDHHKALIAPIRVFRHPNADRVQLGIVSGFQVIVGMEVKTGDIGVYFPEDTVIGKDYAEKNMDLLEYFEKNLRVRTQTFRGQKSEGFWAPLETLYDVLSPIDYYLEEGNTLGVVGTKEICKKYINPETERVRQRAGLNKKLSNKQLPNFRKHFDTEQVKLNWKHINKLIADGIPAILTWKLHGTSARTGNVLVPKVLPWYKRLLKGLGVNIETNEYRYIIGSRNVMYLGDAEDAWYNNEIRTKAAKPFIGKLFDNEVVYYEIVGYQPNGSSLFSHTTTHIKDKKIKKQLKNLFGDKFDYSYGCEPGEFKIFVYRIAMEYPNGIIIDRTWDQLKQRCKDMGVEHVVEIPHKYKLYDINQDFLDMINSDIVDPIDDRHVKEGVCLRFDDPLNLVIFKDKTYTFKLLEGIVKEQNVVDIEEAG